MKVLENEEIPKNRVILHKNDQKILALLCHNVRLPLSKIASVLKLSRQSVEYRIKVMEKHHLIAGSRAVINIQKLSYSSHHFFLTMQESSSERTFIERCKASEVVNALINYSGKWNYEVSIMAHTPAEALNSFLKLTEGISVIDYTPTVLLNTIKSSVLPEFESMKLPSLKYMRGDPSFSKQFLLSKQDYKYDSKDLELLYHLSQNCRTTLAELGRKLKLTNDAISYRVKKLVRAGYIAQFRPIIDYSVLGKSIETILIKIRRRTPDVDAKLQSTFKNHPNIVWAVSLFGSWDYLVYLLHEKQDEIHDFIRDLKKEFSEHLIFYEVLFAYQEYKYSYMTEAMKIF